MKGDAATILPAHVTRALLAALYIRAIPERRGGGWPIVDEEAWWLDVLHDPRAQWPPEKRLSATGPHAPAPTGLLLQGRQPRIGFDPIGGGSAEPGFRGGDGRRAV